LLPFDEATVHTIPKEGHAGIVAEKSNLSKNTVLDYGLVELAAMVSIELEVDVAMAEAATTAVYTD
jgi:hypothetical protein